MNKKIIITTSALAFLAVSQHANADPFKGFYAGVKAGWSDIKPNGNGVGSTSTLSNKSKNAFIGGAQLGYSDLLNNFYLAGEFNFDFVSGNKTMKRFVPGIDLKAGYKIGQFVPYITLGVASAKIKVSDSKTKNKFGLRPGVGILMAVTDNIRVGGEYTYTNFGKVTDPAVNTATIKPRTHNLMARVSYSF